MYEQTKRQHSLRSMKLEPLPRKETDQIYPQIVRKNTDGTARFKQADWNQRHRMKTDHTGDSFYEKHENKRSKCSNKFQEEYLRLVQKLKVNLCNQYFQRKRSRQFVKERPYFYSEEPQKPSKRYLSKQPEKHLDNYDRLRAHSKDMLFNLTELKQKTKNKSNEQQTTYKEYTIDQRSKHNDQIRFNQHTNTIGKRTGSLHADTFESQQNINYIQSNDIQITVKKYKKLTAIKQQRKNKIKNPREVQPKSQEKQNFIHENSNINLAYPKIDELCFHFQILLNVYEICAQQQIAQSQLLKRVKHYVLGNKKVIVASLQVLSDDIGHLQSIFMAQSNQKDLRGIIFMERVLMILLVDLIATATLKKYLPEIKQILQSLLGLYLYLLSELKQAKKILPQYTESSLFGLHNKIRQYNIHFKKELASLTIFIDKKLFPIMKSNPTLMGQIKILIAEFQDRNISINRSFYELLKMYAIYLNYNQQIIQRNYAAIKTFATCPSPYLTKPAQKKYTLVMDLDQTLIHVRDQMNKLDIFIRPFAKQFLDTMSASFEIVIFTSSMPVHSESIIGQLPGISYTLYRYHTTRVKNRFIKDISRLGRPLQRVIIVDNEEQNFGLHGGNGIRISEWRGGDKNDQQLNVIGLFLKTMADKEVSDVREYLGGFIEFRKKYV